MITTFALLTLLSQSGDQPSAFTDGEPYVASGMCMYPTELFVDLKDDTDDDDENALESMVGGDFKLNSIHAQDERFFLVTIPCGSDEAALAKLRADPRVENAEPNYLFSIPPDELDETDDDSPPEPPASTKPDDPLYAKQWSFKMIDVETAWQKVAGEGVVVAVIDTGVAFEDYKKFKRVEDLEGTGFVTGYDFIHDTDHPNDDHGHGTHVAGTIAQTTNNAKGVAGIAPKAKIMPLKVLSASGSGTAADIADAIRFAADEGANVINMSLGGGMRSLIMESAVAYARKKGVVVVCAAGNNARGKVEFPAAYKGAFAVSSVGPQGELAYYSSWGKELAVSAPGGDKQKGGDQGAILQNTIEPGNVGKIDRYLAFQGTSMAAPHVAGVAALIFSAGVTDADQVESILKTSATDVGEKAWDEKYGAGIVNAGRASDLAAMMGSGWWRLISGVLALAFLVLRWWKKLPIKVGALGFVGAVMASAGLPFVGRLGGTFFHVLSQPIPSWDLYVFGASGHATALLWSAIPMVVAGVLFLQAKRLRGLLLGLTVGWAVHLFFAAVQMPADVQWVPGIASGLDRAWLAINGLALLAFASLIARVGLRR